MQTADAHLQRIMQQIADGRTRKAPLEIVGGGSKRFYGEVPQGEPIDTRPICGISSYEPSELVVTARAGTTLAELETRLQQSGQCLPFEPPRYGSSSTVGGMVAAGLAGPSRASVGSVRDHVLGMTLINGKAEIMTFGGQVAKNVAGYDLARLMVGAMGILGVILEVSIKVLPVPVGSATLRFACDENEALRRFASWAARPLPINASAWVDGELRVRLSGARAAVEEACRQLGGERLLEPGASSWWTAVRDQQHPFFADLGEESLWRLSVPPRTDPLRMSGTQFIEWQGGLRWWRTRQPAELVRKIASGVQGHATLLRGERSASAFQTPTPAVMDIHRRLKSSFDPEGILNRGRLYPEL